jgi:hypothetical protein
VRWLVCLGFVACTTSTGPSDPEATPHACPALVDHTFASLIQGECGLGPTGPVPCTWTIAFMPETEMTSYFTWAHSDYGVEGDVQCQNDRVFAMPPSTYEGSYDGTILTWDGVMYARQ